MFSEKSLENISGNGLASCTTCMGKGVIFFQNSSGIPATKTCKCTLKRKLLNNLDRGWHGLSQAQKIESSPLLKGVNRNVFITSTISNFRNHLRHVALRQSPDWFFKVETDKDMVNAWLALTKVGGQEIFDKEVEASTVRYLTLEDLVEPPSLLILLLGVKNRNSATPEVLMEAVQSRLYSNKPTWIVDQPDKPWGGQHMAYSSSLDSEFKSWARVSLQEGNRLVQPNASNTFIRNTPNLSNVTNTPLANISISGMQRTVLTAPTNLAPLNTFAILQPNGIISNQTASEATSSREEDDAVEEDDDNCGLSDSFLNGKVKKKKKSSFGQNSFKKR